MGLGVSWAGETRSPNWFDTAREFTERWHHQQQIRLAVWKPGIMTRDFYFPVLDCFMRALPYHYHTKRAAPGTLLLFRVTGSCGGSWNLYRNGDQWMLIDMPVGNQIAEASIPEEIACGSLQKELTRHPLRPARTLLVIASWHFTF